MVAAAEEAFGRLDILFNNAGVMLPGDDDAVTTEEARLGPHDGGQRQRRVPRVQARHPGTATRRRRLDHQHRLLRRHRRGRHARSSPTRRARARCSPSPASWR